MNKIVYCKKKMPFLLSIGTIILSILLFLPAFPVWGQEEIEKTTVTRKENKDSRLKRHAVVPNQEQEIHDSLKKIPWDFLSSQSRLKINRVISEYSLFRRMPQQKVYADPEMFQFLSEHPDLVVGFWEKLGITQLSFRELDKDQYLMKETTGTSAVVEVVYRTNDICIIYAKGLYKGPFLVKSYDGEVVLIFRSRSVRDVNNEPVIICDLEVFVRIDHLGVDFLAKLFATTLGKVADSNFEQTVAFVGYVSESAGINAESVKRAGYQVKNIREAVREDFGEVVDRVAMRIARRNHRNLSAKSELKTEMYPIPADAPFTQKRIYRIQQADNTMILAVSSEEIKQEFNETFQNDPFFAVHNSLEDKKNETVQSVSRGFEQQSGFEQQKELSDNSIPVTFSVLNNSGVEDEEFKTEYNIVPKSRAVFTIPKVAR